MIQKYQPGETPGIDAPGITLVFGFGGSGKTTLALSAVQHTGGPLFYANFDRTAAHLLKGVQSEYYYVECLRTRTKRDANAALDDLTNLRDAALLEGKGVFILDNWAAQWDTTVLALAPEGLDPSNSRNLREIYADPNAHQRSFWTPLAHSPLTVIVTAPPKSLWGDYKPPQFIPDAWTHHQTLVTNILYTFVEGQQLSVPEVPRESSRLGAYKVMVVQAKKNPAVQGAIVENPTWAELAPLLGC